MTIFPSTDAGAIKSPLRVKPKILIIEDDIASGSALRSILTRLGMEVSVQTTLAKGISAIDTVVPDWIVLDLMLPDGDGEQVLRHLRSRNDDRVRVCVTTATSDQKRLRNLSDLRPDCILPKPIDLDALLLRLKN